jgi:hypothetical protein
MVDALALRAEEGRGTLRKASGSRVQALYPGMPEWGNPLEGGNLPQAPLVEHIDQLEGTRGTETS